MKKVIGAGGIFYCRSTKRFLFLLRDDTKYKNKWGFPGGKIESNETIIGGLEREINEELGIQIDIEKTIPIELFTSDDGNFCYHTFILIIKKEFMPNLNNEHCGYAWVSMEGWPAPLHPGVFSTLKLDSIKDKIKVIVDTI
jgi:8-oxo-dGTP pyrophosphatase MutT (NUDIX family)